MKKGKCNIVKMTPTKCHFAQVGVTLDKAKIPPTRIDFLAKGVFREEWIKAIINGVEDTLKYLNESQGISLADVFDFRGTDIDTTTPTIWCASVMATFKALGINATLAYIDSDTPTWNIEVDSSCVFACSAEEKYWPLRSNFGVKICRGFRCYK